MSWMPMRAERAAALVAALGLVATHATPAHALPTALTDVPVLIDQEGIRLGVRVMAETFEEPALQEVFGVGRTMVGGLSLGIPLHALLVVDLEVGFHRLNETVDDEGEASGDTLLLMPMSLLVQGRLPVGQQGEIYVGVGPSLTSFNHDHPGIENPHNDDLQTTPGSKGALEMRVGFRIDTGLIQPARAPGMGRQFRAVDLEGYLGRRHQFDFEGDLFQGYDLSAFRVGLGLSFRF